MKAKTVFFCTRMRQRDARNGQGRCRGVRRVELHAWSRWTSKTAKGSRMRCGVHRAAPKHAPVTEIDTAEEIRFSTGMGELDRVLGGGSGHGLARCWWAARRASASPRCCSRSAAVWRSLRKRAVCLRRGVGTASSSCAPSACSVASDGACIVLSETSMDDDSRVRQREAKPGHPDRGLDPDALRRGARRPRPAASAQVKDCTMAA